MGRKEFIFLAIGVGIAFMLQQQIASFADPILASVKLSYS